MAEEKTLSLFTGLPKELQDEITNLTYSFYERNQEDYILQYYTKMLAEAAIAILVNINKSQKKVLIKNNGKSQKNIGLIIYWVIIEQKLFLMKNVLIIEQNVYINKKKLVA